MSGPCRIGLVGIALAACGGGATPAQRAAETDAGVAAAAPVIPDPHVADRAQAPCPDAALHVEAGVEKGWLCPDAARAMGLTIVDLSEHWAPLPFTPADAPPPKFRDTYLALAAEQDPDGGELAPKERLVEMYGITPAPSVVLRRLEDDKRHACHAAIDNSALGRVTKKIVERPNEVVDFYERKRKAMFSSLERQRKKWKLPDVAALGADHRFAKQVAAWQTLQDQHDAVVEAQQHLVCEGFLAKKWTDGRYIWLTSDAVELYQRNHFLLPDGELDDDTRVALATDEVEHSFRAALRVLRERVVDATGLIEDGTASTGPVPILGRQLEPEVMRHAKGRGALKNGAPDLIGPATEAAAIALGWTTVEGATGWLARHKGEQLTVAIALPPPPSYHSAAMVLHAIVDRGDVWYDLEPHYHTPAKRPAFMLYAMDGDIDRPLVQWPTTIGGWQDENEDDEGTVDKEWKESDVGPRMWRDLFVAPSWQPPDSTPDADLLENLWNGHWRLKKEVMGPGPRSAYGMVMLVNYKVTTTRKGKEEWDDHGIRVHGSASVTSVIRGNSHGCHRLLNHLAVRLGSFLLRHHEHIVKGDQKTGYHRVLTAENGDTFVANVKTRGYLYELQPPIPVMVTKGRIRSARKRPPPHSSAVAP